jgi:hypothetical protein
LEEFAGGLGLGLEAALDEDSFSLSAWRTARKECVPPLGNVSPILGVELWGSTLGGGAQTVELTPSKESPLSFEVPQPMVSNMQIWDQSFRYSHKRCQVDTGGKARGMVAGGI